MTPRLLILSFSNLVSDPRVRRQVNLFASDYDVVTCGYGPAPEGVVEHIEVDPRLAPWRANKAALGGLMGMRRHSRLYFGSERIRFVQREVARREPVDIVLANDALAAPLALSLRPRLGVHADLHEYAPRQGEKRSWKLLVGPLMDWACRTSLPRVHSLTTVGQGIAQEYERQYGVHAAVVPNATPYRADLAPSATGERIGLVHMGVAAPGRHLDVLIDAVDLANRQQPGRFTLDLYLLPSVPRYHRELVDKASRVDGVAVNAPVPFEHIVPTLNGYDLGLHVLPPVSFNHMWALPNKFFEFVQARLGVLIGPSPEMARLVREHSLGVVAPDFTSEAVGQALASLRSEDIAQFKAAAHDVAPRLDATRLSEPWVEAINAIARRGA